MQPYYPLPERTVGPGSQPADDDGAALEYLHMPSGMATYRPPILPEQDEAARHPAAIALLGELLELLREHRVGDAPRSLDLRGLSRDDRTFVNETLGEGEVGILLAGDAGVRVQETRLAGVWRVCGGTAGHQIDRLEVAEIPRLVRATAFTGAALQIPFDGRCPPGVMNAPAVLVELCEHAAAWRSGDPAHVINLTLLPQTEADLAWLDERLGAGPISILSRGYGNCRIQSTGLTNTWWVRHYNSDERLILSTLEVTEVPAAALAAQEDIEDSAERLVEILEALA